MRNPFEEFPVSRRSDGCRHETGYSAKLLQDLFMIYSTDLFVEIESRPTCFVPDGVATYQHLHFYLLYKYVHVR
jgi:hypothetical protein